MRRQVRTGARLKPRRKEAGRGKSHTQVDGALAFKVPLWHVHVAEACGQLYPPGCSCNDWLHKPNSKEYVGHEAKTIKSGDSWTE